LEGSFRASPTTGNLQKGVTKDNCTFWSDFRHGNKQKMSYKHFWSWLLSVMLHSGVQYLHTTSRQETVDTVVDVSRILDKKWDDSNSTKTFRTIQPPGLLIPTIPMTVIRDMAVGMGWDKSTVAAQHFKTVRAAANATFEEWLQVPGINKVLAARLVEGATEEHKTKRRQIRTRRKK
jgi:hypothetical protein